MRRTRSEYTIVRLLPVEGGDLQYRIKCAAEPFERTARESDLTDPDLKATRLSSRVASRRREPGHAPGIRR